MNYSDATRKKVLAAVQSLPSPVVNPPAAITQPPVPNHPAPNTFTPVPIVLTIPGNTDPEILDVIKKLLGVQ
jgi:hypothetical protein